jgi:pimeloyl-ACP methyl ester carboxylesterase
LKGRLIIVSDLWGLNQADWLEHYQNELSSSFDIRVYDARLLAGIDLCIEREEEIHLQFVEGGIEKAIEKLMKLEDDPIHILAFSIGGTIAWKAALKELKVKSLTVVSSTRLRKETQKPNCKLNLYFGEEDQFKPAKEWFKRLELKENMFENKGHEMYKEESFAKFICKKIKA